MKRTSFSRNKGNPGVTGMARHQQSVAGHQGKEDLLLRHPKFIANSDLPSFEARPLAYVAVSLFDLRHS